MRGVWLWHVARSGRCRRCRLGICTLAGWRWPNHNCYAGAYETSCCVRGGSRGTACQRGFVIGSAMNGLVRDAVPAMSQRLPSRRYMRKATRLEHAAAEQTAVMRALFDARLSEAVYIRLLLGYHALYSQWEAQHARWLGGDLLTAGWCYRSRLPAIEADLHLLGAQAPGRLLDGQMGMALEVEALSPEVATASWGSLYVVEGSALGGQVIARKLATDFPGHPHLFFNLGHGHGQPTWRDFQTLLDGQLSDAASRRAIALQARVAFGRFQHMLESVID
jgi:heme oxygenase